METTGHEHNAVRMRLVAAALPPVPPALPAPVFPSAARTDARGLHWIIDRPGHRLFIYNQQLALVAAPGGQGHAPAQFHYPADAAFSLSGRAFIADSWNHRIQVIDTNSWQFVQMFGGPGREPGRLMEPRGVLFAGERLIVSERENHRLSLYDEDGRFLETRARLSGLRSPLTCPACMVPAGRHIVLLAEPQQALVLDAETLYCENSISLAALPAACALYPAADNAFLLTTLDGGLHLVDLNGAVLHSTGLDNAPGNAPPAPPAHASMIMIADLPRAQCAPVFVRIENSPGDAPTPAPAPHAFALRDFKTALEQARADRATHLFVLHAASPEFLAAAALSTQDDSTAGSHALAMPCVRSVDLCPAPFDDRSLRSVTRIESGEFIAAYHPQGMARITERGAEPLDGNSGAVLHLAALPGGVLLAVVRRGGADMLLVLDEDGGVLRNLGQVSHQELAAAPCVRDAHSFYMPEPNAGRVAVRGLESGQTTAILPVEFDGPAMVAAARGVVYVLERGGRITAVRDSGEILWRTAPEIADEEREAVSVAACPESGVFAVLAPRGARTGEFSRLAQLDPDTGRVIRSFDHFADPDAPGEAMYCEDLAPPLCAPHGIVWAVHRIERRAYAFQTRIPPGA